MGNNSTTQSANAHLTTATRLTGAEIVWATLVGEGVTDVFGYPGGAILPVYDALRKFPIHHVLVRHEQGASHMADGYARATGRPGVCLATSGPGATNLVTGLATAHMDSIPVIAITGQVRTEAIGSDAFQEADTTGITRPVTKHTYLVKDVRDMAQVMREAFYIATTVALRRSRVTSNSCPISSRVCSRSQPIPNRKRITFSSLGESVFRIPAVSSRT